MSLTVSIFVFPFGIYFESLGVTTIVEFRKWVSDHGEDFKHGLANAGKGDIIVFAWMGNGEWYLVGDAIVKINEKNKEEKKDGFRRRIVTRSVRLYAKDVSSKELSLQLGEFVELTPKQYLTLLQRTVTDC